MIILLDRPLVAASTVLLSALLSPLGPSGPARPRRPNRLVRNAGPYRRPTSYASRNPPTDPAAANTSITVRLARP